MIGLFVVIAGVALVAAGGFLLYGPAALVAAGAVLITAGLAVDWEELTHGKPAPPAP